MAAAVRRINAHSYCPGRLSCFSLSPNPLDGDGCPCLIAQHQQVVAEVGDVGNDHLKWSKSHRTYYNE